jgi:ATP-binding cassette, subfamily C (CFTR/MRP), member 4
MTYPNPIEFSTSPLQDANILSRATFHWASSLFYARGNFEVKHLWPLLPEDSTSTITEALKVSWQVELQKTKPSLLTAFYNAYSRRYLPSSLFAVLKGAFIIAQTMCLAELLSSLAAIETMSSFIPFYWGAGMVACAISGGFLHHVYFMEAWRSGMHWRCAAMSIVFEKSLKLRLDALAAVSAGRVVNLCTNDAERFTKISQMAAYLYVAPLECAVILWLLYRELGPSTFAGMGALLVVTVVQSLFSKSFGTLRGKTAVVTDARVKATAQVVVGIRVLKMQGWESAFKNSLFKIREKEVALVRIASVLRGINEALFTIAPIIVGATCFFVFVAGGGELTPRIVFVTLSLFSFLQIEVCKFFPMALEGLAEVLVSLRRIEALLLLPEVQSDDRSLGITEVKSNNSTDEVQVEIDVPSSSKMENENAIELKSLTCRWKLDAERAPTAAVLTLSGGKQMPISRMPIDSNSSTDLTTLSNISMVVKRGSLCAVVGAVGCGKSSLLLSILRELQSVNNTKETKNVLLSGSVAYVSQSIWIVSGTVKHNIVMGRPFDETRFQQVLLACCLDDDVTRFPDGVDTYIGERGINLSGGQKARIGLARACYIQADVVLLDDVLSAVDSKVGAQIVERCILGLLRDKTRVLVTHQLHYTRAADKIVVMGTGGVIAKQGTFAELMAMDETTLASLGNAVKELFSSSSSQQVCNESSLATPSSPSSVSKVSQETLLTPIVPSSAGSLVKVEAMAEGGVKISTFLRYCSGAGSIMTVVIVISLLLLGTSAFMASNVALALWSGQALKEQRESPLRLAYGLLVAISLFLSLARASVFFSAAVAASDSAHKKAFLRVLCAPVSFFDANPSGRILNRFSKELGVLDDFLPLTSFDFANSLLYCLAIVILVIVIAPWVLIAAFPLAIASVYLRSYYMMTARTVKRLESTSRSPCLSLVSEALNGLPTLRSFRLQKLMIEQFRKASDDNVRAYFAFITTNRWLGLRLDCLCFILLISSTFICISLRGSISPALIGLSLSNVLQVTNAFQWAIRQSGELENSMISVERLMEYSEIDPIEDIDIGEVTSKVSTSLLTPTSSVPSAPLLLKEWPTRGEIQFNDMWMTYRKGLKPVLRGISFKVPSGSRVGVVGRTGAGKSSLFAALLRLVEPTFHEQGNDCCGVMIDNVDIADVPLSRLRRSMSLIPQDPVLYAGSLRYNLDPFKEHNDAALLNALECVQLRHLASSDGASIVSITDGSVSGGGRGGGLDSEWIEEGGGNLSVGERQLLCLGRAILRRNKVLLMDEATANVDLDTDRAIQKAVRDAFKGATVLTIAHRLDTVRDYDLIVVLGEGKVIGVGPPNEIIVNGELNI